MKTQRSIYAIKERIYAEGIWEAKSALHVGGEKDDLGDSADMVLLRDSDGNYFIPGASIAGAGRTYLARMVLATADFVRGQEAEPLEMRILFGDNPGRGNRKRPQYASLLTVHDALVVREQMNGQPERVDRFVRDGVRIKPESGTAMDAAKYDFQVLPAGAKFQFRLWLTLYKEPPGGVDEQKLLGYFQLLLQGFEKRGEINMGARTRRGLGEGAVNWKICRLKMDSNEDLAAWLGQEPRPEQARAAALRAPAPEIGSQQKNLVIDADLELKTSLLVRSAAEQPGSPDMTHLTENGKPTMPGTSIAGALRHRCERIARTLQIPGEAVERMFGPNPQKGDKNLRAGKIWVSERRLENGNLHVQSRVAIDRFTGGALESALFDEAPFWPKQLIITQSGNRHLAVRIRLEDPTDQQAALLLLAFKDLWLGDLPLGGESGVGRGVFHGIHANIVFRDQITIELTREADDPRRVKAVSQDSANHLDTLVRSLQNSQLK